VTGSTPEPVPVAFLGRTSTLYLQDPAASIARQYRSSNEWLPPGWFIAASFWDIESGGLDIEARGHGTAHERAAVQVPRDGGLADLLAEAASPLPRFAAVICEDIERSGRDTFNALKLEKELARAGVPLFATDEPADIAGANATTVLVRRVKQGVAEWFRLQIKEKSWKGLKEHSLAGWNIGTPPYGYLADRVPHPVPYKAAQGRTKTRLALDPDRAPVVTAIYAWRTEERLGIDAITNRLNASPAAYPPPTPAGWIAAGVRSILANPKYTGHMVFGRRRTTAGKTRPVPPPEWLWSPEPTHPAIITRATWDAAQVIGAWHGSSRDGGEPNSHPATRRTYVLRGRIRCRACQHRMSGITRTSSRYYTDGPDTQYTYYACQHNPARTRPATAAGHPRTISVREEHLIEAIRQFYAERIFGPDRAALLAAQLPATAAQDTARRQKETARLTKRLHQIDAAENAHAREIEALAGQPRNTAAITALRTRIIARFTELETERTAVSTQLAELATATAHDADPALLDALPILGDILNQAPARLRHQLYDAFGIELLYRHDMHQVTIYATVTATTPATIAAIMADSDTPGHAPASAGTHPEFSDLTRHQFRRRFPTIMEIPLDPRRPAERRSARLRVWQPPFRRESTATGRSGHRRDRRRGLGTRCRWPRCSRGRRVRLVHDRSAGGSRGHDHREAAG